MKKKLIILVAILLSGFLFLKYYIGFQHVGRHWQNLQSVLFDNQNPERDALKAQGIDPDSQEYTTEVVRMLESPIDTLMWVNADFIPEGVAEALERYKKRDFSKLVLAQDFPTDEEAQRAIVHRYKSEVVSLLQAENAHIKIGTCYAAPLQSTDGDGSREIARVTAMVSAFNKQRGNLGNIQQPLDIIYDFVKYDTDPETWYITDFSQNIPYDYKLNKDRW